MKNISKFRKIKTAVVALILSVATFMSTSISTFATVDFVGTSGGSGSSGSMSGSYIAYYDSGSNSYAVGYRFAVISNEGKVSSKSIIDVYNSRHDTSKKVVKIGGRRKAKQEIITTGNYANQKVSFGNWNNSTNDIEYATCSDLGIKQLPVNPAEIDAWVTENNNARLDKVLQVVGSSCSSILSDTAMVSVEPIFEIRANNAEVSGTISDLAVLLGQLYGSMSAEPTPSSTPGSPKSISKATNRILPNLLYMNDDNLKTVINPKALAWYNNGNGATKIGDSSVASYNNLISKGYGVGICYGKVVNSKITVRYHDRQESTYNSAHIIKRVQIPRGSTFNLTYVSDLGLTNGDYNFTIWIAYDNGIMSSTTSGHSWGHFWGYTKQGGDGWYTKNEASISDIVSILDGSFLSPKMTSQTYSDYIDLYPVWETSPHKNIRYYKDYNAYQTSSDMNATIYDPYGTHANTQLKYTSGAFTQNAPLLFPNASIDGSSGHGAFTDVLTAENTTKKYRTFAGWVIYNTNYKRWGGMCQENGAWKFRTYATYEEASAHPIYESVLKTYFYNTSNDPTKPKTYINEYGNSKNLNRFNAYFGKGGIYQNLGDFYVVGVYTNQTSDIRYRTAMTDSDTIEGYLKSIGKTTKSSDFYYYLSGSTGLLSDAKVTSRKDENRSVDIAHYTYWAQDDLTGDWWVNPGYPWDTSDPYVFLQTEQSIDSYKANIEHSDYSIVNLSDCYSAGQLDAFASLGKHWDIQDRFTGFEFGGWTFAKCYDSNFNDIYFGYSKGASTPGWHLLRNIDTTRANSDTSYYGFYVFQPNDEITKSFLSGTSGKNIDVFSLWKKVPTYTVNYYEDGKKIGSQKIDASAVIAAQTKGTNYQFYSRYNKRLNSSPNSAYDYLGWSYDSSANATPNIGFEFTNGNDTNCFSGYKNYSSTVSASPTGFTWQTGSDGNKFVNLYAVWNLKPYITVKYNPNGDMDYVANSGDGNGITGTMPDKAPVLSDAAIANGIPLDSCAYVKESYTFNKWAIYSSQMNGYYGKRAGATSYEWITDVNEVVTFKTISSTDTLFTSENAKFLKDTGVTSGEIILFATWNTKYDVYYTTQHPAGSNIVSNYDLSLAGDGYPVHKEYPLTSFNFFENKFEDKSGNYEYKGWSVYITDGSGNKTYYCDNLNNIRVYQPGDSFAIANLASLLGGAMNIPGAKVYVEAQWKPVEQPNSIVVKYNPNGDMDYVVNSGDNNGISGAMSDEVYTVGTDISIANNLYKKNGNSHNGWVLYSTQKAAYYSTSGGWTTSTNTSAYYVLPKSGGKLTFSGILNGITDGELILYAVWKPSTYTIKYNPNADVNYIVNNDTVDRTDANGVKITGEMADTVVTYGVSTQLRDVSYQYPNHTFVGWVAYRSAQDQYYVYADESLKTAKWVTVDELKNYTFGDYGGFVKYNNMSTVSKTTSIDGDVVYMFAIWAPNSYTIKYNPNADVNYIVNSDTVDRTDSAGVKITGEMPDTVVTYGVSTPLRDVNGVKEPEYYFSYPNHSFIGWVAYRKYTDESGVQKTQYRMYTDSTKTESATAWIDAGATGSNGSYSFYMYKNEADVLNITPNGTVYMFAVWKADACSVQFVRNTRCGLDGYVTNVPNSVQAEKGSEFTIPSGNENTPKLSDGSNELEFIGWNTEPKGAGTSYSPGSNITLSQSVLNENDTLVLYAQWKINLDISLDDVYYTLDGNGSSRVEDHIKLKENSSYFTFLEIHNNSIHFDVSFGFTSNVTIANKSLNNGGVTASGPTVSKGSIYTLNVGRVTVTPPSDNSLTGTFFTADSAIVKLTGQVWIASVINPINGGKVDWTYHETNNDNDSKKLEKNFVINAPKTSSSHQALSSDVYSGQLIKGTHSYSNMSLFDAIFSFFAERYNYSNLQVSRYDEDFVSYNDGELLMNSSGPFSALGYNVFTESKSYRYRNVGTYPISFADSRSKMSWLNSNPEIFGESRSTLTVYPIDLIADNINVCKEGSSVVYNKGVHPEETYSVEATYLLKTMLGSVGDLHTNIQVTVFGITEDGDREYICQSASSGVTFSEHTTTDNGYVYQLKLKTDSFTVAKKYTGIYINGYIYDSDLMHTAYSTFFEQNGTNNTFEMDIPVLSPFDVEFIKPNAWYTRGKEVVSGFRVTNNSPYNLKNDVGYTISVYDAKKITKDTVPVERKSGFLGVPSANTTMVWIKWTVPDDMPDEAYIKIVVDTGAVYNTKTITASWGVKDNLVFNTPDTAYSDNAPYWYSDSVGTENAIDMSSYNLDYNNKGNDVDSFSWSYFVYNDATDAYLYVTNEVSANGTAVISKKGCPDTDDGSIKSGYGYGLNLSTSITSTAPEDAVTGCQNAYVAFPEFNNAVTGKADNYYQFSLDTAASYLINPAGVRSGFKNIGSSMANIATDKHNGGSYGTFATLKKTGDNFEMPINSSTGDATHFIPIWMPDGDYEVTGIIDEIWTPMGMISKKIVSNTLKIDGNMYDDFKVSHYTIKQAE